MKFAKLIFVTTFLPFLVACSEGGFEGDYEAAGGMQEFNFKPDGYMVQSLNGNKVAEFKFEKDGDEIRVYMSDDAAQTFTLQESGEIVGPGGVTLTPKK